MLTAEALLLPISGLAVILPGPNVFFGYLALLTITHWQALKGISRLLKKEHEFISSSLFKDWEQMLESKKEVNYSQILGKIEKKYNLHDIHKVLWK